MSPLFAMSTQSRHFAEIEVESLDEPVDCVSGLVSKDFDQIVSS